MSNKLDENIHLLQTLSDKNLSISARQQLAKALPKNAFVVLREIFFNVAIGSVAGFSPKVVAKLHQNRLLVFKIVDENKKLTDLERQNFVETPEVLEFLVSVLPPILKSILAKSWCCEENAVESNSFKIKIDEDDDESS